MSLSTLRSDQDKAQPLPVCQTLGRVSAEEVMLVNHRVLVTQPASKDEAVVRKQACRLLSVAKTAFTCQVIDGQKHQIAQLQKNLVSLRLVLGDCIIETIGRTAILKAIKLYANNYFGLSCYCKFCCDVFGEPQHKIVGRKKCEIFPELIEIIRACGLTFAFLRYYKGDLCELHPSVPAVFPPEKSTFPGETLSHVDEHIVFERMGNPYDFKFGKPLHFVDSLCHPEGRKLHELVKRLHDKAMGA